MSVDIPAFLEAALLAARQVGVVARRLQGQVANEGKPVAGAEKLSEFHQQQAAAKTAVDEIAQDILITALAPHLPRENCVLDGEEDTPALALLPAKSGDYALVLDPLDGTLIYLNGGNSYSVNIGLFHNGRVAAAVLYYPALDVVYWTDGKSVLWMPDFSQSTALKGMPVQLAACPAQPQALFCYYMLGEGIKTALGTSGLQLCRSFPHAAGQSPMQAMLQGQVGAAVLDKIQVRDVIHGALLVCAGGYMHNWKGEPLSWPQHGGLLGPCVISAWPLVPELQNILRTHAA